MIVMEPAEGIMEVAPLPSLNKQFTTYRLEMSEAARSGAARSAAAFES